MNLFTEPAERAKAMGVFGFVLAGGGSIGVLLGGVLTDVAQLALDLPRQPADRDAAVVALSLRLLPAAAAPRRAGGSTSPARSRSPPSLMLAVYAIVNGNEAGWTSRADARAARRRGRRCSRPSSRSRRASRAPLVPLGLFRLRNVATANVVGVLWAAAMFAWFFLSALYLQLVLGYSPLQVGLAFLPANLIMGAFSLGLSAKLVMRFGIRAPLATGLLLAAVGLAALRARAGRRELRRRRAARA